MRDHQSFIDDQSKTARSLSEHDEQLGLAFNSEKEDYRKFRRKIATALVFTFWLFVAIAASIIVTEGKILSLSELKTLF